jgi:signal transduction histidine kinase
MPQDFSGQNLQGISFAGLDLSEANFSYTDIRGADFSQAILRGANFSYAKAGLQRHWAIGLVIGLWLLSGISGLFSGLAGFLVTLAFDRTNPENFSTGLASLIMVVVFFIISIWQGIGIVAFGFAFAVAAAFDFALALGFAVNVTVAGAFAVTVAAVGAFAVAFAFAGSFVVAGTLAVAGAIVVAVAGAIAVAFVLAGAIVITGAVVAVTVTLLGAYIGWRAVAGDEKYALIRDYSTAFVAKGTSFHTADLTDADFTSATLKSTDFRNAILTRTCWHGAE